MIYNFSENYHYLKHIINNWLSNNLILITLVIIFPNTFHAQSPIAPGQWRDHLPYKRIFKIIEAKNKIYCLTPHSLFYINKTDNTFNSISRVQGLAEASFATIAYDNANDILVIIYDNFNIDFLSSKGVTNFPIIKNKLSLLNKRANNAIVYQSKVYIACGFGIVVIDLKNQNISDTYYIGTGGQKEEVTDISIDGTYIYASTTNRIYKGLLNDPFLVDNSHWLKIKEVSASARIKQIAILGNKLYALIKGTAYRTDSLIYYDGNNWSANALLVDEIRSISVANDKLMASSFYVHEVNSSGNIKAKYDCYFSDYALTDADNNTWVADRYAGLYKYNIQGIRETVPINSPTFVENVQVDVFDGQIWTTAGSLSPSWLNEYNKRGFAGYFNNQWHSYYSDVTPELVNYHDFMNVRINPYNPTQVFISGWWAGVVLFENEKFTFFTDQNSSLQQDYLWPGHYFVYGLAFDNNQNLWVTNSRAPRPLSVRTHQGKWKNFPLPLVDKNSYYVGDIIVTSWGHKWITIPKQFTSTLIIFDDNNTIENENDDRSTTFSINNLVNEGNALVASNYIYCLAEDKEGDIWLGTDAGVVRITGAPYIFSEGYTKASKILVSLNIGENLGAYLLETERINAIAVDGGNRKWIATQNSGAYLVSPDGTTEIQHFTVDNSPLLSNTVLDIAIDHKTGEVFFATDKGLISYRGYSTAGNEDFGNVYVFPNPVRENYTGDIIITNLLSNAIVKITDVSGNLVYETRAFGGQAVWNGKNYRGQRVATGVYLVFCSNDDGTKTKVVKLLFIH